MIRTPWTLLVCVVSTVLLGAAAALVSLFHRDSHMTMRLGRLWSRMILGAAGIRLEVEHAEHARADEPRIFVANHQSMVDIWVTLVLLPRSTVYIAKHSLFRVPFIGWAMRASGFIAIDRSDRERATQSLEVAARRVRGGRSVCMFPEGTRARDGVLKPFKKGGFHLALRAGVPLVPVAISGSWHALRPGTWWIRPGTVRVRFAPPVETAGLGVRDLPALIQRVRGAIAERLDPLGAGAVARAADVS